MAVYSPAQGIPAALVEERDACGVGFIASLNNEPRHDIIQQALAACTCMEHRGGSSADNVSGDGAGIMTAIPWTMFDEYTNRDDVLNRDGSSATAVGMLFLPRDAELLDAAMKEIETIFNNHNFAVQAWRNVPLDPSVLGTLSEQFVPSIRQIVVQSKRDSAPSDSVKDFDKLLYNIRREIQGGFRRKSCEFSYVCSLSSKTIVYKGMLRSCDLGVFYRDLQDPRYSSPFALYHRRFSTNTVPKWFLAQPMRLLAHNGEINTLLGNINWVKSRQFAMRRHVTEEQEKTLGPLVDVGRSDSANLDSILESYVKAGYSTEEALMILVPEAYASHPALSHNLELRAFYEYYESLQEAWDGPALLVFSDGDVVGATLDRNGLRPARYMVTADSHDALTVHVMSEVGVTSALDQFADRWRVSQGIRLVDAGRLGPGEMLSVNLREKKLYLNEELKQLVAARRPYRQWVRSSIQALAGRSFNEELISFANSFIPDPVARSKATARAAVQGDSSPIAEDVDNENLITTQAFFGWGSEDVEFQISAMARDAEEATYCMGDDAPLAVLSAMPHTLYDYFKQRFAQVTNPPIDPLREGAVMSLSMFVGPKGNPLSQAIQDGTRVKIASPVLNELELAELRGVGSIRVETVSTLYPLIEGLTQGGLESQLKRLCDDVERAVREGVNVINLSDKLSDSSHSESASIALTSLTFIPPLLAIGAVHHSLIRAGLRTKASLVVTTGQAWATHHLACLVGYGASAVVPYAAYDAVINWHSQKRSQNAMQRGEFPTITAQDALRNYRKALEKGLNKILSKMGISLLTSYQGAQIFEAVGLADDVLMKAFTGTPSRVSGMTFDEIASECAEFSRVTFGDAIFDRMIEKVEGAAQDDAKRRKLFNYGFLNYFKSGDYHHNNIPLVKALHKVISTKNLDLYNMYEQSVTSRPPTALRDMLQFVAPEKQGRSPVPLEAVESAEAIMRRFVTGGMSLGALSREAHETLAIAMNRMGGKSNSGEGGEDPLRMKPIFDVDTDGRSVTFPHLKGLQTGDSASSGIKQVASGRFGVTPQYLMSASQLEIKIAQGAKPGEGGQLPGKKIDNYIAMLRKSKPGVTLISPPPHHDIYSIEDLAQLIHDLHQINPKAGVSVKLVSEVGIGTVASGVAKAGADIIQISGHDGGTGASPMTSIKHAGSPWELGLVESHSSLRRNDLRERVLLRVDGGLKSGWDVVMAAAMGAEEYGFGTIALIAEGCIMARICHTNKCPVGVTSQNEELRKKFPGTPDNVVTFFGYVAEEVRHILARLGFTSLEQVVGRPGVLEPRDDVQLKKARHVDTSFIIDSLLCEGMFCKRGADGAEDRSWLTHGPPTSNGRTFDDIVLEEAAVQDAISSHAQLDREYVIRNVDRSSFARLSGFIASLYGDDGFKGKLQFRLSGAAGQSFCAFIGRGIEVQLSGYANDYVGKGMAGGLVAISPPVEDVASGDLYKGSHFSMVGNTCLYGATGGSLFVRGRAGERFAVRNSGALGVIEGMGDHGCEYMTAGNIVSLGRTGRNFGAGMTGGLAFILPDDDWMAGGGEGDQSPYDFLRYINDGTVSVERLSGSRVTKDFIHATLTAHVQHTGSVRANFVLEHFEDALKRFWVVIPASEKENPLLLNEEVSSKVTPVASTLLK